MEGSVVNGDPTASIVRAELQNRLAEGLDRGSVLAVAGAGYGKTDALETALAARDGSSLRLHLGAEDASAGYLLDRLLIELREAVPGLVDDLADRVVLAAEPVDLAALRRQLVGILDRVLVDPLTILFDDAEAIADSPGAIAVLEDLVGSDSRHLRVAIGSRRSLPLRVAKLRGAGRLLALETSDLVFTGDETAALIHLHAGREARPKEIADVTEATEGWPLGVALAVRAGPGTDLSLSTPPELRSFLEEEVIDQLDEDFRAALIDASTFAELEPELLTAFGLPASLLDEIGRLGLPSHRSDATTRLHPMFRDLLRSLAAERSPEDQRKLHRAAGSALEATGRGREAVDHWLEAEAPEATEAVAREGGVLVRSAPEVVADWVSRLPKGAEERPAVLTIRGQLALATGDVSGADELLERAATAHREAGDPAGDWTARFERTLVFYFLGDHESVGRIATDFDPRSPACAHPAALATAMYAAGGLAAYGRFAESERAAALAVAHPAYELMAPLEAMRRFYVDEPAGRLPEARREIESAAETLERLDPMGQRPYLLVAGARLLEDEGRIAESIEWWRRAATTGEQGGHALIATSARSWLSIRLAEGGSLAEADAELSRARQVPLVGWRGYDIELATAFVAAGRGDEQTALAAAEGAFELVQPGPPAEQVWLATTLSSLLAALGNGDRAEEVVDSTLTRIEELSGAGDFDLWNLRLLAHRAWLRSRRGEAEGSEADLRAVVDGREEVREWVVRRDWAQLKDGIWSALERGAIDPSETVAALRRAFPGGEPLTTLLDHRQPEIRRAALPAVVTSGDPHVLQRVEQLVEDPDPSVRAAAEAAREEMRASPPALVFRTLGQFEVLRGRWLAGSGDWERPVAARLVRYLLLHHDHAVPEDQLFEALWPGKSIEAARRALQVSLSRARAVLDHPGSERSHLDVVERTYCLRLFDRDVFDAEQFEQAAGVALQEEGTARPELLESAVSLWSGEPLPEDRYEDWAIPWREGLTDQYLSVLAALARERSAGGDDSGAALLLRRLVALDPLHEEAHRELMAAYDRSGRRGQALRQYLECRRALVDELGVEPSEATSRLHSQILAGRQG